VLNLLTARLDAADATRRRAEDLELQNEVAHAQLEAARHAETARVLAEAAASLKSLPSELRAMHERLHPVPAVPSTDAHLREAAAAAEGRQANAHAAYMTFMQQNAADLAAFAGQVGGGIAQALGRFKPPEAQVVVVPGPAAPPPPPSGTRIKKVIKAIKGVKVPRPTPASDDPPAPPPGSRPGSSTDPVPPGIQPVVPSQPHGIFGPPISAEEQRKKDERHRRMMEPNLTPAQPSGIFGPPISAEERKKKDARSRAKWGTQYQGAKPSAKAKAAPKAKPTGPKPVIKSVIKQAEAKNPPPGVVVAPAKDPARQPIGLGQVIPLILKDSPPPKPQPKVKHESTVTYARGTKRKAPEPPVARSTLRKTKHVTTAATRRPGRRVAAADV